MLGRPRSGPSQRELTAALGRLSEHFEGEGYTPISTPHLYLGETLLDLYGEDLRARAFMFPDAERGNELCLRPDFTVPVALAHAAGGWDQLGAYTYQGPVFRRQQAGLGRPVEYQQAGIERFGDRDTAEADARVMALLLAGLDVLGVGSREITIGDLSIPFALLDALDMPARRREALRRHFWRPARFQDLLRRAVRPPAASSSRKALLEAVGAGGDGLDLVHAAGERLGERTDSDVMARLRQLALDAADPAMPPEDAKLIDAILEVAGPAPEALQRLRDLSGRARVDLGGALDRLEKRLSALDGLGVPASSLFFDASFGRNLEYYDGFVFEVRAGASTSHPPLAGGGRYDAMTSRLGAERPVPAVGGMIRPEAALGLVS